MDEKPRKNVEIALRWYCSTCGAVEVIWHSPRMMCEAKEIAIQSAHSARSPQCQQLDYRIVSDSETRPVEDENDAGGELLATIASQPAWMEHPEGRTWPRFTDVKVEGTVITGKILVQLPPAEALLGALMLQPGELPIVADPSIPPDTIEFRSPSGRFLGEVINIGRDDDDIPLP